MNFGNVERYQEHQIEKREGPDAEFVLASDYDALLAAYKETQRAFELSIVDRQVDQSFDNEVRGSRLLAGKSTPDACHNPLRSIR